ncbi:hypothetical protein L4D76_19715 [Photobacterium sagamiensis]|uniref:hypothetical protein n=1 Tax=Photobacterium sagamiensis TaxID=2910241 RepID=UPI003D0B20FF
MPIIATKTIIGLTAAATALGSMVGGGIAGDVDQTYTMAMDYADTKIEQVTKVLAYEELGKIDAIKYGGNTHP